MDKPRNLGMLLLAIYLIVAGCAGLSGSFGPLTVIVPILAIAAGACLLTGK